MKTARKKPSAELRMLKKQCGVFSSPFICMDCDPALNLTKEQAAEVARALQKQFDLWWDTWVEPELDYLAKRNF